MYRAVWSGMRRAPELWQLSWLHSWARATVQKGFFLMWRRLRGEGPRAHAQTGRCGVRTAHATPQDEGQPGATAALWV
jgi:hypothetical protein